MSKVIKSWQMRSNLVKVRYQIENPLKHEDIKPKRTSRMAEGAHVGEQQVLLGGESHRHYSGWEEERCLPPRGLDLPHLLLRHGHAYHLHPLPASSGVMHMHSWYCGFSSNWILHYFPLSSVRMCVCPCVTGVTSHISHIYKGIHALLIIRDPSTSIYSESKSSWLSF